MIHNILVYLIFCILHARIRVCVLKHNHFQIDILSLKTILFIHFLIDLKFHVYQIIPDYKFFKLMTQIFPSFVK